jgi:hypothetical protein
MLLHFGQGALAAFPDLVNLAFNASLRVKVLMCERDIRVLQGQGEVMHSTRTFLEANIVDRERQKHLLFRQGLKLSWRICEILPGLVGQLDHGDEVAYPETKTHNAEFLS